MSFRVVFAPTAIKDLSESVSYIARHDSEAAIRIGDGMIDAAVDKLSQQPFMGPACPEYADRSVRYWFFRNYRVVYEVDEDQEQINVLRYWHCSRGDWPARIDG